MNAGILPLVLLWMVILASVAPSQIVYRDIEPDTILCTPFNETSKEFDLDMNRDGKPDFYVAHFNAGADWIAAEAYCYYDWSSANYPCYILVNDVGRGLALNEQEEIGAGTQGTWYNSLSGMGTTAVYLSNANFDGFPWRNAVDKYLAVRMEINGLMHYGWIRMDVAPNTAWLTVKEYAMNMTPGTPILAGDKGATAVGAMPEITNGVTIYTAGKSLFVLFDAPSNALRTVTIYSLLGRRIDEHALLSTGNALPLAGYPAGCYLAVVRDGASVVPKLVRVW